MLVFITFTKKFLATRKRGGGGGGGGMRSEILHIYPHLSLTLISHPVLQNPTSFFFFYNTLRQCVGSASVLLCLLWQDKNSLIFIKFSLILLLFLQAILKRITAKEPHYNHLQWVKKSNSVVPSFFYSCNHVK